MPSENVAPWARLAAFLGKGPKYLSSYAHWRAMRMLLACSGSEQPWPSAEELGCAFPCEHLPATEVASFLRHHYASRRAPLPLCDWADRESIVAAVPVSARERTIAEADRVLERRFLYRGCEVAFPGAVDWDHRPGGNLDWTWDLNRHHFFVALGRAYWYTQDERYAQAFSDLMTDWLRANPPCVESPPWRVFEASVRVANWCWGHALFLPSKSFGDREHAEFLRGLLGTARFLHAHIERHAWNNHLLLESKALAMVGLLYPELPGADAWRRDGLRLLEEQLERQVLPDGVHSERSSLYHEIIASELLEYLVLLRLLRRDEADPHQALVSRKLAAMACFQSAITRRDGSAPLLGDSSRHDGHLRYHPVLGAAAFLGASGALTAPRADEDLLWLLGSVGQQGRLTTPPSPGVNCGRESRAFPQGGYYVLESSGGADPLHLVFDCGPFGDPIVPGHGHADALSIDLAVGESHVLVDPGMYSAHLGERWRNFFRGTAAHNTVVVDGMDQSILSGLRHVYRPARARLLTWETSPAFDIACGEHDGYRRLSAGVTHRREIFFRKARYWVIVDRLEGEGSHSYELLFHLCPGSRPAVDPETHAVLTRDDSGRGLAILPVETRELSVNLLEGVTGNADPAGNDGEPQGWAAFVSGVKEAAPVVCHLREGAAPARFATVLWPLVPGGSGPPRMEALKVLNRRTQEPADDIVAGKLCFSDGATEIFLSSPWVSGRAVGPGDLWQAGGLETDAALASVSIDPEDRVCGGVVFRGSRLVYRGRSVVSCETRGGCGQLAFHLEGSRLEVQIDGPQLKGSRLRLDHPGEGLTTVLVDGEEFPFEREGDAIVLRW